MAEQPTPRQERAAERLLEDEGLTEGLSDAQARPLIGWAGAVAMRAATPEHSDDELGALLLAVRKAVRRVAREAADEGDPDRLLAMADGILAELAPSMVAARAPAAGVPMPIVPIPALSKPTMQAPAAPAQPAGHHRLVEALGIRRIALLAHYIVARRP